MRMTKDGAMAAAFGRRQPEPEVIYTELRPYQLLQAKAVKLRELLQRAIKATDDFATMDKEIELIRLALEDMDNAEKQAESSPAASVPPLPPV